MDIICYNMEWCHRSKWMTGAHLKAWAKTGGWFPYDKPFQWGFTQKSYEIATIDHHSDFHSEVRRFDWDMFINRSSFRFSSHVALIDYLPIAAEICWPRSCSPWTFSDLRMGPWCCDGTTCCVKRRAKRSKTGAHSDVIHLHHMVENRNSVCIYIYNKHCIYI